MLDLASHRWFNGSFVNFGRLGPSTGNWQVGPRGGYVFMGSRPGNSGGI